MQVTTSKQFAIFVLSWLLVTVSAPAARSEQTYSLSSNRRIGDVDRVRVKLEVGGTLQLAQEEQKEAKPLKMSVVGEMRYDERFLEGQPMRAGRLRSARYYERAMAAIKINDVESQANLRLSRALISVAAGRDSITIFSPDGPLTRDELDVISVPGNTLVVETLLPGKPVAPGDGWHHSDAVMAGLLGLDSVRESNVSSSLTEVDGDIAKVHLKGSVHGTSDGVATTIQLKGRYQFDLGRSRITWFALLLKENRSIGHVSPGVEVTARLQAYISPNARSEHIEIEMLSGTRLRAHPALTLLSYQPAEGKYRFSYDRHWYIMTDEPNLMTMRLVDDGELIAQCKVSTPVVAPKGKRILLSEFQDDVQASLGNNFGQFTDASTYVNDRGQSVRRVVAVGGVSDLSVQWNHYLITDGKGNQVVFAFTFEASLAEQFGNLDAAIVDSLEFFPQRRTTARRRQPLK